MSIIPFIDSVCSQSWFEGNTTRAIESISTKFLQEYKIR